MLPDVPGDLDGGLVCLDLHADLDDVEWLAWAYQQCSLVTAADSVRTNNDLGDAPRGANQELLDHGTALCRNRFCHADSKIRETKKTAWCLCFHISKWQLYPELPGTPSADRSV